MLCEQSEQGNQLKCGAWVELDSQMPPAYSACPNANIWSYTWDSLLLVFSPSSACPPSRSQHPIRGSHGPVTGFQITKAGLESVEQDTRHS